MPHPSRRDVLRSTAALGAAAGLPWGSAAAAASAFQPSESPMAAPKFNCKFAPHFGMFQESAGPDPIDQLKFAADQGFSAWEDNGMKGRSPQEQERIAKAMADLGIAMGVFVVNPDTAWGANLSTGNAEARERFLAECRSSVEVAKRVNATWMTVVPGTREGRLNMGFQTANVIDALRAGAEIFEPHGLVMVLEPLNFRDHPNMFLDEVPQAHAVCRAVDSPACKILFDLYHQQITEGNLIPNIDAAWSETAYFQIGDNPGRREPTTGEINYANVFAHIHRKGYRGVLGMEHGKSRGGKEGEDALIAAYRSVDARG